MQQADALATGLLSALHRETAGWNRHWGRQPLLFPLEAAPFVAHLRQARQGRLLGLRLGTSCIPQMRRKVGSRGQSPAAED